MLLKKNKCQDWLVWGGGGVANVTNVTIEVVRHCSILTWRLGSWDMSLQVTSLRFFNIFTFPNKLTSYQHVTQRYYYAALTNVTTESIANHKTVLNQWTGELAMQATKFNN